MPFFLANSDGSQILHVRQSGPQDVFNLIRLFAGASTPLLVAYASLALIGVGVTVYRAARSTSRADFGRAVAPLFWLLVPVLTIFLLSYVKPMFKERYLFGAMPAFPLLAALGLMALRPLLVRPLVGPRRRRPGAGADRERPGDPPERELARRRCLHRRERPARRRRDLHLEARPARLRVLRRLAGRRPPSGRAPDDPGVVRLGRARRLRGVLPFAHAPAASALPEFADRHQRIWLVLSHEFDSTFDGDTSESIRTWLTRRGYAARQRSFTNVRVLLYERTRP